MANVQLIDVTLPDFGVPDVRPELALDIYTDRLDRLIAAAERAGIDCIVVYADREHSANIAYLTGFEPRFEEALLVIVPGRRRTLITGPENQAYAAVSPMDLETVLYPPFGLLGQDRRKTPPLADVLSTAGVTSGQRVGVAGWKYFGPDEADDPDTWLETPAYIVDTLRRLVGDGNVVNANRLLMDSSDGLRAINEIDQLAQFEHASSHASEAVKRVLFGARPGMREVEAMRLAQFDGRPTICHPMLGSGARTRLGLGSPTDKMLEKGEPMAVAIGYWGSLTCRAGWLAVDADDLPDGARDYVEKLAAPYFDCAAAWYETVGIGVTGGEIDAMVKSRIGDPFFGLALNPGHLIHLDEWMNTPIYPDSGETLRSGQAIQLDIIPATGTIYATANIEDGIALLDDRGRDELRERHPAAWARIEARRAFMADVLGIRPRPEVLPFSNLAGFLPPFFLSPSRVLIRQ
ncbi:MAG: hypothetical protein GY798_06010 [Hyphomicrobiales bacterium]|nr:hypothetical protein [Hyphomicrobiales bacterium]